MTNEKTTNISERKTLARDADGFSPLFLKLPPENIVQLKFLLESYEGLGVLRTLNKRTGLVVVLALKDTRQDLESFIEDVTSELQLVRIEPPEDWDEASIVDAAASTDD